MPHTLYTARFDTAELVQRGRSEHLSCRTYRAGQVAAVTQAGSTVAIYDGSGDSVVAATAVTVVDGVATYTLPGATTAPLQLANNWRIAWALVMGDGATHLFENRMVLCRRTPSPVITEQSIYARVRALNPEDPACITKRTEYSDVIDDAWYSLVNRLVEGGKRIELVTDPTTLREAHLTLTIARIYDDLAARINPSHRDTADSFHAQYEAAWGRLVLPTDEGDNDGIPDQVEPARGPVWVM